MLFGAVSESGRSVSCVQSSWSPAGGGTSLLVADEEAASQDSPLTAGKLRKTMVSFPCVE